MLDFGDSSSVPLKEEPVPNTKKSSNSSEGKKKKEKPAQNEIDKIRAERSAVKQKKREEKNAKKKKSVPKPEV